MCICIKLRKGNDTLMFTYDTVHIYAYSHLLHIYITLCLCISAYTCIHIYIRMQNGSIIWGDFGSQSSEKILAFDLDGTLIVTKSKKRFAQNRNDWLLFDPIKTPLKIKAYHDDG